MFSSYAILPKIYFWKEYSTLTPVFEKKNINLYVASDKMKIWLPP